MPHVLLLQKHLFKIVFKTTSSHRLTIHPLQSLHQCHRFARCALFISQRRERVGVSSATGPATSTSSSCATLFSVDQSQAGATATQSCSYGLLRGMLNFLPRIFICFFSQFFLKRAFSMLTNHKLAQPQHTATAHIWSAQRNIKSFAQRFFYLQINLR